MIIMLNKEFMCLFLDTENIWSGGKIESLSQILRKIYDNFSGFMTVILDCAFLRNFQRLETHIRRYTITRMLEMRNVGL